MKNLKIEISILLLVLSSAWPDSSWAWGRRGHQIVGENAALLASGEAGADFLRAHSFDFGYYANVPDFIWKRPATYSLERNEHYVNLEIYDREFAKNPPGDNDPYALSRTDFEAKYPSIKPDAGRAFWRIRELNDRVSQLTTQLRELKEAKGDGKQALQAKWLVTAGVMAHYVGDLGMPLHVTENHDGQLTDQKGVHSFFEDQNVDQLYPEIDCEVRRDAVQRWPTFSKANRDKSVLQLVRELAARSFKQIPAMLAIDKKMGRDLKKTVPAYHGLIRQQLVDSTLVLAEIYRRQLGWIFDGTKFYFFAGEPEYIPPGVAATSAQSR